MADQQPPTEAAEIPRLIAGLEADVTAEARRRDRRRRSTRGGHPMSTEPTTTEPAPVLEHNLSPGTVLGEQDRERLGEALVMARNGRYIVRSGDVATLDALLDAIAPVVASLVRDAEQRGARCGNCDHLTTFHGDGDGCRYTITTARIGANLVCVCTLDQANASVSEHR